MELFVYQKVFHCYNILVGIIYILIVFLDRLTYAALTTTHEILTFDTLSCYSDGSAFVNIHTFNK